MIMRLQGNVIDKGLDWALVNIQGVGYRAGLSTVHAGELRVGDEAILWTHEVVRDDTRELYGFRSRDALELFWKLISVNGVGPKAGVKILGMYEPGHIRAQVMDGKSEFLTKVPGIGKKTAQKIVLELKGSIDLQEDEQEDATTMSSELVHALESLGYPSKQARDLAKQVPEGLETIEEQLKSALQIA